MISSEAHGASSACCSNHAANRRTRAELMRKRFC